MNINQTTMQRAAFNTFIALGPVGAFTIDPLAQYAMYKGCIDAIAYHGDKDTEELLEQAVHHTNVHAEAMETCICCAFAEFEDDKDEAKELAVRLLLEMIDDIQTECGCDKQAA